MAAVTFWHKWWSNFISLLDSTLNRVAIFATLVAFFGLQYSNIPHSKLILIGLGLYTILLVIIAKPPFIKAPNLTEIVDLNIVNTMLSDTPRVGILGLQNAGKTTFLDATVVRKSEKRQTEKPYGQFVTIPDSSPKHHIVLLDSVGAREHVQFLIQAMANCLLLFIDHNESDILSTHDEERLRQHENLATQLIHTAGDNNLIIDRLIVVVNKSDLWQQDEDASKAVQRTAENIQRYFQAAPSYRVVDVKIPFSNESRGDVADLLKVAA